ncbi:MAG: hypothetical protein HY360_24140 [Verrucomicrobia bacterium]|nr:hypothetical protein [Verrucomicrobiota bacterium]
MATTEKHPATFKREMAPPSVQAWMDWQQDASLVLEHKITAWLKMTTNLKRISKELVYDAEELLDINLRCHRRFHGQMIAEGEALAIELLEGSASLEADKRAMYLPLIDQKLSDLVKALHQWHGKLEDQKDVPDSFLKGVRDIEEGKVVDMEQALSEPPK